MNFVCFVAMDKSSNKRKNVPKCLVKDREGYQVRSLPNKRSDVFDYFGDLFDLSFKKTIDNTNYYCKLCFNDWQDELVTEVIIYSKTSTTGIIKRHLEGDHNIDFDPKKDKQRNLLEMFSESSMVDLPTRIVLWFAASNVPFLQVEIEAFKDFFKSPNITQLPSRETLTRCLTVLNTGFLEFASTINYICLNRNFNLLNFNF